jgi:hypothetical protein
MTLFNYGDKVTATVGNIDCNGVIVYDVETESKAIASIDCNVLIPVDACSCICNVANNVQFNPSRLELLYRKYF